MCESIAMAVRRVNSVCIVLVITALAVASSARAAPLFRVTDLGDLSVGSGYTQAYDVNNLGQVVGYVRDRGGLSHPFIWQNGTMFELDRALVGEAVAISDGGRIVGALTGNIRKPAYWDWDSGTEAVNGAAILNAPMDFFDVNASGRIVGSFLRQSGSGTPTLYEAVYWDAGQFSFLGYLPSSPSTRSSFAYAINESGLITGWSRVGDQAIHAFRWESGVLADLGDLPGGIENSSGLAINRDGDIAGYGTVSGDTNHAVLWRVGEQVRDLGVLGGPSSLARGINKWDWVVGDSDGRAFLWLEPEGMLDLALLIDPADPLAGLVDFRIAHAVNDVGQIVVYGGLAGDREFSARSFLLTPVPVSSPGTLALIAFGVAVLGLSKARQT
jgi:probable HAF family extracellular repeat protein